MNPRIDELKQRLREIDARAGTGALSADAAAQARAQLERELVDLVMQPAGGAPATPPGRPSGRLLGALAAFVLVLAAAGYAIYGTPSAWRGVPRAATGDEADPSAQANQIETMVGRLEQRLQDKPEDAEGWAMLGRSYSALGRYPEAVAAFKRVAALRPGDAQALADQADAVAMAAGRKLAGEPEQLIARALALDPKNLKALALAGTIAFDRNDYAQATRLWEAAVAVAEPGSELARNLQSGVAEARARAATPAASGAAGPAAASATARVGGRVQLAAALKGRVAPDDTLFVFARAVDGPRVPLAILRKQVKDLPLDFMLDDTMAMNPSLRLSTAAQVVVGARISKSGNAIAQPGDLQGFSAPVPVGTRALKIEISDAVK